MVNYMKKVLIFICITLLAAPAYAYKKSDWSEFKEAKGLCAQKHSAMACARAAYLYTELYNNFPPPPEIQKDVNKAKSIYEQSYYFMKDINKFYETGCSLGDPVQCINLYSNKNTIKVIEEYSDISEGVSASNYDDELKMKNRKLRERYLKEKARNGYQFENDYYQHVKNTTISEIKKNKQ